VDGPFNTLGIRALFHACKNFNFTLLVGQYFQLDRYLLRSRKGRGVWSLLRCILRANTRLIFIERFWSGWNSQDNFGFFCRLFFRKDQCYSVQKKFCFHFFAFVRRIVYLGDFVFFYFFRKAEHRKRANICSAPDYSSPGIVGFPVYSEAGKRVNVDAAMKKEKPIYEDLTPLQDKAQKTLILIGIIFIILLFSFWKIQILDHKKYWSQSEANRIREIVLPPQRGLIKDRNGIILATNIASFKVSIIRENCQDIEQSYRKIAQLLDLDLPVLRERIDKYKYLPLFQPIVIKDSLNIHDVAPVKARQSEFPELIIQAEPKRKYPYETLAAHVIGYLQEISQKELSQTDGKRRAGDLVGKTGIEREYDNLLAGREGRVLEIADSLGRRVGEISRTEPVSGQDIRLTMDFNLQSKAQELLEGREGAVAVLDPRTGEILALASFPTFDPNKFISRFSPDEWLDLMRDPEFPLENRAIRGLYAPGSLFKLTIALGALDSGVTNEWRTYYCTGSTRIYGHPFSCWFKGGHGSVNLYSGIKHSCNIYFYQIGKLMGIEEIARYARMLGLGTPTGVDLPGEKEGLVPDPDWKKRVRNEPWYPGETISVSIGQGPIQVTPLQMASYTAVIANRGSRVTPFLFQNKKSDRIESARAEIPISIFNKVIAGMWGSVNEGGTGRGAKVEGFDVCGKTGSTQVISTVTAEKLGKDEKIVKTHSWYTGFAPRNNPEIVVTILVEYGGLGGTTAAPLAGEIFRLYREKHDR
jgi:penicillin-binding protein 2